MFAIPKNVARENFRSRARFFQNPNQNEKVLARLFQDSGAT
ncbi:hypothetical protein HMPREF1555_00868 [Porphyromonas gingivalis F0570]|uniref:Uncharacterized protein n=1 Tax=Porphyromonas gingivalis F0570 TaxID=1227271 RepID=A0A0E2M679_PORGN|nr:hypothetical protein HMPREF1555_00868 [Porphyromonas gingivalis F0570]